MLFFMRYLGHSWFCTKMLQSAGCTVHIQLPTFNCGPGPNVAQGPRLQNVPNLKNNTSDFCRKLQISQTFEGLQRFLGSGEAVDKPPESLRGLLRSWKWFPIKKKVFAGDSAIFPLKVLPRNLPQHWVGKMSVPTPALNQVKVRTLFWSWRNLTSLSCAH